MAYPIWQATITDDNGNVLPGAEITVVNETTGLNATLYSTRNGTVKSNPFFATVDGFAQFYADPGLYRITATDGGTGTTQTFRYVRLVEVGTAAGNVMEVGAGGWISRAGEDTYISGFPQSYDQSVSQIYRRENQDGDVLPYCSSIHFAVHDSWGRFRISPLSTEAWIQGGISVNGSGWTARLLHSVNTTVDPNGFIKQASPIVSLYKDRAESNGSAELEEMQFERIATGHYRLTGVPELSRDGWYIETPKDRNGNVYFTLDYVESEGQLDIRTYTPDYSTGRATNGAPVDIIDGRFVSLRFAEAPETTPPEEA